MESLVRIRVILMVTLTYKMVIAMRKMMKTLVVVAVAAIGLTACHKDIYEQENIKNSVTVSFVVESAESRTSVDTSGDTPTFAWGANETFAILEQTNILSEAIAVNYEKVDGKAVITAEFDANEGQAVYNYVAVYPAESYISAESIEAATLALPATQTMAEGSYDPNADLMVSSVVATDAQPTDAQYLRFTRLAAVAKMNIKGVTGNVESVIFSAEGKSIAGTITADLNNPHEFTVAEGVSSINVAASANEVYFTTLPFTLEAEDAYTVTVITDSKIYVKEGVIPVEKSLAFEAGMVTRFNVDMSAVTPSDKWVLVKDASTLKEGDVVAIAAANSNYVMGAKWANNYPYASETEVVKIGDYLYHPISTDNATMVQKLTIAKRENDRNAFDFYNAANDYDGDDKSGFLWAPDSGSKYLKLQDYYSSNTQFDVTIDDAGVATIIATNGTGSSKQMMYNSSTYASSRYFHCYSEISDAKQICIYRLEGAVGTLPTVAANVSVPDADEYITIAEEGTTTATAIEEVVFNYVGNWNIAVSDNADWLTVSYADGVISYTAEANSSEKREAAVTITASLEGEEDITWTFNMLQKGAPQEITITELRSKTKDVNTVYKVTGRVATIPSSTSGAWVIEDESGNQAKIAYLKTDSGSYAKDNVGIKVGDVMTVTTVVTGTNGTSNCGNSTYSSIYKGHFTITATASGAVGFEGGDATISIAIEKFGHIVAPTAISDNSNVATDNNPVSAYSFTDNGDSTATAVVSFEENTTGGSRKVDLTFSAGSTLVVSTTITVMQDVNPALKTGWWLVTDVNDLVADDKIIIAATGLDYAISTATNTNSRKSTAITKNGGALEDVSSSVQQYTLEIDENGRYSFKGTLGTDADKYIYAASSSSNYMKVSSTLDDNGKFTVEIDADGAATIIAQGTNTRNHMQYNNKSTSSPAFYCTDGSFGDVCLYKYFE